MWPILRRLGQQAITTGACQAATESPFLFTLCALVCAPHWERDHLKPIIAFISIQDLNLSVNVTRPEILEKGERGSSAQCWEAWRRAGTVREGF
jgi:hypothetical protein